MADDISKSIEREEGTTTLLSNLRELIQVARQKVLRAVDSIQVQTCWEIGRHIVEVEQSGAARAEYGAGLLQSLAPKSCFFVVSGVWERVRRFRFALYAVVLSGVSNS